MGNDFSNFIQNFEITEQRKLLTNTILKTIKNHTNKEIVNDFFKVLFNLRIVWMYTKRDGDCQSFVSEMIARVFYRDKNKEEILGLDVHKLFLKNKGLFEPSSEF